MWSISKRNTKPHLPSVDRRYQKLQIALLVLSHIVKPRPPRALYNMGSARGTTTDGSYAFRLRPSWSFASAPWSYMVFRRLISASHGSRVTVQTISFSDMYSDTASSNECECKALIHEAIFPGKYQYIDLFILLVILVGVRRSRTRNSWVGSRVFYHWAKFLAMPQRGVLLLFSDALGLLSILRRGIHIISFY